MTGVLCCHDFLCEYHSTDKRVSKSTQFMCISIFHKRAEIPHSLSNMFWNDVRCINFTKLCKFYSKRRHQLYILSMWYIIISVCTLNFISTNIAICGRFTLQLLHNIASIYLIVNNLRQRQKCGSRWRKPCIKIEHTF